MSWDIQRPGGDQGMPPSVVQPCISHEQLLSNRDGETDRYNLGVYFGFSTTFFFVCGLRGENRDFQTVYSSSFVLKLLLEVLKAENSYCSFGAKTLAKGTQTRPREQRNYARFVCGHLSFIVSRSLLKYLCFICRFSGQCIAGNSFPKDKTGASKGGLKFCNYFVVCVGS